MSRKIIWILIALLVIILVSMFFLLGIKPAFKTESLAGIRMPDGFKIDVFAGDLDGSLVSYPGPNPGPRMLLLRDGVLFVTIPNRGSVVALPDMDGDNFPRDYRGRLFVAFHGSWNRKEPTGYKIVSDDNAGLIYRISYTGE